MWRIGISRKDNSLQLKQILPCFNLEIILITFMAMFNDIVIQYCSDMRIKYANPSTMESINFHMKASLFYI